MGYIQNTSQLLSHGNIAARQASLDIIESAIAAADPYRATHDIVHLHDNMLSVGDLQFVLEPNRRIFVIGAGKATFPIATALEDILYDRITDGVVICKYGQKDTLSRSRQFLASHPLPDEAGFSAAQEALALARQTQPGDIVFGCITGGSSALMPYPVEGITLEEKKVTNQLLLTCGANILEINAVRKHLSRIKAGKLAMAIHPGAHLINLTVSDVIGDALDYITDPSVPDTSTLKDARRTMTKYDLWQKVPVSVAAYLKNAGASDETPKASDFSARDCHDFILLPSAAACDAAAEKAKALGFNVMVLSSMFEGESRELGRTFAAIAREIFRNGRPMIPPCVIIGGGETTVKISGGEAGLGGPNQEFALGAAADIDALGPVVVAGIDSDGTDGPTDVAGALVDDQTTARARQAGLDLHVSLHRHDVTAFFEKLEDTFVTGATGTNVNDLKLMVIGEGTR